MTFDPEAFARATYETPNDTVIIPIPAGVHQAQAQPGKVEVWTSKDHLKSGLKFQFSWEVLDPAIAAMIGRKPIVQDSIMLDLTEAGALDFGPGRNTRLGRFREAIGMNEPGKPFSFSTVGGQVCSIEVRHRMYEGETFAEVKGYAK